MLDPTRTGVAIAGPDPAAEYTRFAFGANDISRSANGGEYRFSVDDIRNEAEDAAWHVHLTTLFPEVRPRGHFEVRSCDAIDGEFYAAPIVFLSGLAYDARSAREAAILAADSRALLRTAGEFGMRDPSIARTARDLFQLALAGARRLGEAYCGGAQLETAEHFFATYTARDRSPADDRMLAVRSRTEISAVAPLT
jgi:glutamate--cysteine ligase